MVALRPPALRSEGRAPRCRGRCRQPGRRGPPRRGQVSLAEQPTVPEGQDARAARVSSRGQFELALC